VGSRNQRAKDNVGVFLNTAQVHVVSMILPNTETMFHAFASLADVYASVTTPFRLVCMIWFGSIVAAIVIFFVNLEVKKHPNRRTKDDVKQERQEHIRRSVNTKKLCDLSVIRTTTTKTTTRKALNDTESDSIAESLEDTSCAICLGDYQKGEIVCWSRNAKCNHVFHLECAEEWLMRNVECPCCRFKFIFNNNNNNNTNGDNTFLTFLRGCTCFILAQLIFRIEVVWVAIVSFLYLQQSVSNR
jgi:hypothetical protein